MAEKNLIKIAKGNGNGKKPAVTAKKPAEKKVVETKLSPDQERNLKAKQTVEKLLEKVDLDITSPKKDNEELIELDSGPKSGVEWLEEQIGRLSEENSALKSELELSKADYAKVFDEYRRLKGGGGGVVLSNPDENSTLKVSVIKLFNEIQANYVAMGKNFVIVPPAFLNRLVMFFPFLQDEKKF